jgi:4-hydroxyphenylpyruvate dioxygenase-like putative hemolysin
MKAEFSFIEYSYNPLLMEQELVYSRLRRLGFVRRAQRDDDKYTFWRQDNCILLLAQDSELEGLSHVTGLGFITDPKTTDNLRAKFDHGRNMFYIVDPAGIKNYLVPFDDYGAYVNGIEYLATDDAPEHYLGLKNISGIVYSNFTPELEAHYQALGFRQTRAGAYTQYTAENNRFTIAATPEPHGVDIGTVLFSTKDIFDTTARACVSGARIAEFEVKPEELDFAEINHLIVGYNCLAIGDSRSYVIENFLPEALPNMDHVYSMSKKSVGINEEALYAYYGLQN